MTVIPLLLLVLLPVTTSYKILVAQLVMGKSHMDYSGAIVDSLVEEGHIVDKLILGWNHNVSTNGTTKARRVIRIDDPNTPFNAMAHLDDPFTRGHANANQVFPKCRVHFCEKLLKRRDIVDGLRAERYDAAVVALFDGCLLPLMHIVGIKSVAGFVATSSADNLFDGLGLPTMPSYTSSVFDPISPDKPMNFLERVESYLQWWSFNSPAQLAIRNVEDPVIQKYYPGTPVSTELFKKITYVFLNMPEFLDIGRPISGKVKFIGGLQIERSLKKTAKVEKLPQEYEDILSSAKGTVVFSLGSLVRMSNVPQKIKTAFADAFKQLHGYNVIWKHEDAENQTLVGAPNVFFKKWIPQKQLLADARVKLFISHMGLNSYTELAYAGVPVVMVPVFADQDFNAGVAARKGLGLVLRRGQLDAAQVLATLRRVLGEPEFARRARLLSRMLHANPQKAQRTLVAGLEYAVRFPELAHLLQLPSVHMGVLVAHSLDVLAFLGLAALGLAAGLAWTVRALVTRLGRARQCPKKME